jgi:hypothetical protein
MLGPVAMEVNTMVAVGQMATLKCEPGEQPTPFHSWRATSFQCCAEKPCKLAAPNY